MAKVGQISFSFNTVTEKDQVELADLKELANSLDIRMVVLHVTNPERSIEFPFTYNTKVCFEHQRDENLMNHLWCELQVGWTVEELIHEYFETLLDRFYP